jgi:PAS domain-containing protein
MTSLHLLTVRTAAAIGRLSALQKRAERLTGPVAPVIKPALKELSDSLEELQVANEQLQQQVDLLSEARMKVDSVHNRMIEFVDVLPVACLWTDNEGQIVEANGAAASLLNVSSQHLNGRPLMFFIVERDKFRDAQAALNGQLTSVVEMALSMRPRERRARQVRLTGRRLQYDDRRCWFIQQTEAEAVEPSSQGEPLRRSL